jgi:hypothetical protein
VHVGRPKRLQIDGAGSALAGYVGAAPRQGGPAEFHHQGVRDQPGMPAVAIWERVDGNQSMMKSDRDFVGE